MAAQGGGDRKAAGAPAAVSVDADSRKCGKAETLMLPSFRAGVCLKEADGWLFLRAYNARTGIYWEDIPVTREIVFGILASTTAEPLWPSAMAFVGADGAGWRSALRARAETILAKGRSAPGASLEHYVSGSVVPTLQAADLYSQAGDMAAARRVLREKQRELEERGAPGNDQVQFDWVSLNLRLAKLEANAGRIYLAFTVFDAVLAVPGIDPGYRANVLVNYAAYLAEFRSPRDALRYLGEAEGLAGPKESWVPGSARQFGWIRACALHQLGDAKGVKAAMAIVTDPYFDQRQGGGGIMSTDTIEARLAYCMGDDAALARLVSDGVDQVYQPGWYLMQEGMINLQPGKDEARRRAAQRLLAGRNPPKVRQLPAALHPAMNGWLQRPADLHQTVAPAAVGTKG